MAHLPIAVSLLLLEVFFMQRSGVSLTLTWPCRFCLFRVLLDMMPLLQAFPFPSTLGEVTLHQLSQACMFIYSSHGKWVFPLLLWSFPPTTTFARFPSPDCWAGAAIPAFSSQPVVRDFPSSPFVTQGALPSLLCVFFVVIVYYSVFFLFSLGGCQSLQGAMLIWPKVVCGSTMYCLAHLVIHIFPSRLCTAIWRQRGSPPGFSI
jgi:hypothetical protein